nr:SPOR domain-containing protein [bacterium]
MAITNKYMTKNRCYLYAVKIKPEYIIVHSTGSAVGTKERLFSIWNTPEVSACPHGATDATGGIITLPLDYKGWHVGAAGNNRTIGFEICEPPQMAYVAGTHNSVVDTGAYIPGAQENIDDFNRRWRHAVEMAAYMCRETGLGVGNIVCHAEAHKMGFASNHADTGHWFPLFGKNMDDFRRDVAKLLAGTDQPAANKTGIVKTELNLRDAPNTGGRIVAVMPQNARVDIAGDAGNGWLRLNYGGKTGYANGKYITVSAASEQDTIYRVQIGAFTEKQNADRLLADIAGKGYTGAFITQAVVGGKTVYRVQVGAFYDAKLAQAMRKTLAAAGYADAFVTE